MSAATDPPPPEQAAAVAKNGTKELVEKYRGEFQEQYEELRKYSQNMNENVQQLLQQYNVNWQNIQPQVAQQTDEVLKCLRNMEPIQSSVYEKIVHTFAWVGIMQLGIFVASIFSGYLFFPLVGLVLGSFWAFSLAFLLLPVLAYLRLINIEEDDRTTRFKLLGFALAEGVLTGYLYSQRYLSTMQPLAFITPFAVAAVAQQVSAFMGENASRMNVLGACLGSSFLAHLVIGLPLGQLGFSYFLLALLYTGVAFCVIQLYVKFQADNAPAKLEHLCMLGYVVGGIFCQGLVFFLLGGAKQLED